MNTYTFRVIIEPDENNTYRGFAPLLPGCHTWGDSIEKTKANMREAIICHVQGLLRDNELIPQENEAFELIQIFSDAELREERVPALV